MEVHLRKAVIAGLVLGLAFPAHARKFKAAKATDAELVQELATAQAPVQQEILAEMEKRDLSSACPALGELSRLDDAASVRKAPKNPIKTLER